MPESKTAPAIAEEAWGKVTLEDGRTFKDVKLWPGGAREWDWGETGTSHGGGIQPGDVRELLDHGSEVVVLSRGRNKRLNIAPGTLELLEDLGVETVVLPTPEAIRRYGELRQTRPVGALIHSTC